MPGDNEKKFGIPSDLRLPEEFDFGVQQFGMRTLGYGAVAGLASLVLLRARGSRTKVMALGAGFGCGDAYRIVTQKNQPPIDTKKATQYIPSELRLGQKWDYTIQQFGMRTLGYGFVAAIASIVLARHGRGTRLMITAFGAGVGVGDAYRLSNMAWESEKEIANDDVSGVGAAK